MPHLVAFVDAVQEQVRGSPHYCSIQQNTHWRWWENRTGQEFLVNAKGKEQLANKKGSHIRCVTISWWSGSYLQWSSSYRMTNSFSRVYKYKIIGLDHNVLISIQGSNHLRQFHCLQPSQSLLFTDPTCGHSSFSLPPSLQASSSSSRARISAAATRQLIVSRRFKR